ncbi:MAG TPA: ABATE domain-containing protein [Solirubrobacteraceae bacterium]|nr:ABATE domain-containing protein [Solirubrobacteraceae bacterium]
MRARFVKWDWLGEHPAIDFANTVRRDGAEYVELLGTGADLAEWSERALGDRVDAAAAEERLGGIRSLRDAVFAVLRAAAEGRPAPADAAARVDAQARSVPVVPQLAGPPHVPEGSDPLGALLARLAYATIELVRGGADVGFCDAPSCGQLFLRGRSNQRWCGPGCGTRARVARHAARRGLMRS